MAKVIKFSNNTYLYGALLETGSNENGIYEKYSDGKLIQYARIEKGNIEYTKSSGNAYINSSNSHITQWTYPIQFNTKPDIVIPTCGGNSYMSCSVNDWTRTTATIYTTSPSSTTIRNVFISVIAIGKWR